MTPEHHRRWRRRALAVALTTSALLAACAPAGDDAGHAGQAIDAGTSLPSPTVGTTGVTLAGEDEGRPLRTTTTEAPGRNRLVAALGEDRRADELTVPERPADAGTWKFLSTTADGPVAFDACRPVHYRIRTGPGPDNGAELVREAVDRVEAATGLRFVEDGPTEVVPTSATFPAANTPVELDDAFTPVTIGWATREETDLWASEAVDTLGVGGPRTLAFENGQRFTVSGYVLLVPSDEVAPRFGPGLTVGNVLLHEIGHLVGLDHVSDIGEVMHARLERGTPDGYGPGDRRGLWELGAARGCASSYLTVD